MVHFCAVRSSVEKNSIFALEEKVSSPYKNDRIINKPKCPVHFYHIIIYGPVTRWNPYHRLNEIRFHVRTLLLFYNRNNIGQNRILRKYRTGYRSSVQWISIRHGLLCC